MTRRRKILLYCGLGLVALVVAVVVTGVLVLRSDWFREQVRRRIVAEVERASGGRVEIGAFHFDWSRLTAEVQPLVLHGKEKPGEPPFFRAASIQVGIKIISIFRRKVDIESLIVERPELRLIVYSDGSTNAPSPASGPRNRNVVEQLLNLAVHRFELRNGFVEVDNRRSPLDVRGEDLRAAFTFDPSGPRYTGQVSSRQLRFTTPRAAAQPVDFDADLVIEKDHIQVTSARFASRRSTLIASGVVTDLLNPRAELDLRATFPIAEAKSFAPLPVEDSGDATFAGKARLSFAQKLTWDIEGKVAARGLTYRQRGVRIAGIGVNATIHAVPERLTVPQFTATALGGSFTGNAAVEEWKRFRVDGESRNLSLAALNRLRTDRELAWSGVAAGPVHVEGAITASGTRDVVLRAQIAIQPAEDATPVDGAIDLNYDQRSSSIQLGESRLATPHTRVELSGTLGRELRVSIHSTNLDDVLPALQMASDTAPAELPLGLKLKNGSAIMTGVVTGPLDNPQITAHVALTNFAAQQRDFARLEADVNAGRSELSARGVTLTVAGAGRPERPPQAVSLPHGAEMRVTGDGRLGLENWRPVDASAVAASLKVQNVDIQRVLAENGRKEPVEGIASGTVALSGTYGSPRADIRMAADRITAFGEELAQCRATVRYATGVLELLSGDARLAQAAIHVAGSFTHPDADWRNGEVRFTLSTNSAQLSQVKHVQDYHEGLTGQTSLKAAGAARLKNGEFEITTLDSRVEVRGLALDKSVIGNAVITAETSGETLLVRLTGDARGSQITGSGEWRLSGDDPGHGEVHFTPVTFATLRDLSASWVGTEPLPFQGSVDGNVVITGPLRKPDQLTAIVTVPHFEVRPGPTQRLRAGARVQDLVLRNTEPLQVQATTKGFTIQSARFQAKDTNLEAVGRVTFDDRSPWNLRVRGSMNLAVLQLFNADLLAQGNATVNTLVTGPLRDPQMGGRLELRNASLYLGDLPAGVDNANGVIQFDRNRATIERLTAEVGGGKIGFGGFIGFGGGVLIYRVQATANEIRIRPPNGASVTFNASLNLTGTSQNGLISGTVTVLRAGFAPRTDLGSLLAESAQPISTPETPNETLRGINFDVRIESGPSLELQTSLTRDTQVEAELRLRGNAARPALVGDISVNQGQIQLFGNKYEINRGDIRFVNPTRIEPTFDVDLETKARGITVNISFSGSMNKMNVTYRSDPPLQTNEIIALLAVGRDPNTTAGLASAQAGQSGLMQTGANTITQAISAPVSSRLQRFFGVSRLKIDPQLTGVENIPQARLTLEQQVSRDITVTYMTNLTRTQEQIVRIQWDIGRKWSAIATREENGVFGIDFQYRKRFK